MRELEKILEEIEAEFDRRIDIQLKIMAGLGDDVYRYGYGKSLEAYQQGKLFVEDIICKHMNAGWIPVEERLPENNKLVLVWARSTARGADEWSLGSCDKGFWALGSYGGSLVFPSQLEAVAWRPLPEPYHPGKER